MKKGLFASIFFALVLVLAACGGGDNASEGESSSDSSGSDGGTTVDIAASNWEFDQDSYTIPAGEVTFNLTNEEGMHGIEIEGTDVSIEGDGSATATLEPGEYTIHCSVMCGAGHDDMKATLTVE